VALYQCSCGVRVEMRARFGDAITSVNHLHRSSRLDGTSAIVRMEEIRMPAAADPPSSGGSTLGRPGRRIPRGPSPERTAMSDPAPGPGGSLRSPVAVSRRDSG